jgi:hypothetical protein
LEQEPLETGSQDQVKGGTLSAGNDLTSPSGQEKAEESSAMMATKRIPVRKKKAAGPVRKNKETVQKRSATIAELQRPVRRNSGNNPYVFNGTGAGNV